MSSPPPSGSGPNIPAPPLPPGVPMPQPDRGASQALAGFLCGLASFIAVMLGIYRVLFVYNHIPGFIGGEGGLLILAACPVALAGLILFVRGRQSMSRLGLAIAGLVLSALALGFILLFTVLLAALYAYLHPQPPGGPLGWMR